MTNLELNFEDFLEYDKYPSRGNKKYNDSGVFEFEFSVENVEYYVKAYINIYYTRWYEPETWENPSSDECDLEDLEIDIIKAYKYDIHGDETELKDKEIKKLHTYLEENLNII